MTSTHWTVAPDGHGDPTLWITTGPDDTRPQAITTQQTLDIQHPALWPALLAGLGLTP